VGGDLGKLTERIEKTELAKYAEPSIQSKYLAGLMKECHS